MKAETKTEYTIPEVVLNFRNLSTQLWRKKLWILGSAFLFGLLGIAYAWIQKPVYKATLSFVAENEGGGGLGAYAGIAAQFGLDLGGGSNNAFEGDNLIELLKSRQLVETTLLSQIEKGSDTLMIEHYLTANRINEDWEKMPRLKNLRFEEASLSTPDRVRDSVLFTVYKNMVEGALDISKRDKKLDLIDIKMNSGDELFAKKFVELLAQNAIDYYTDYKLYRSRQNVQILQRQTDSVKGLLYGGITSVAAQSDLNVNPIRQSVRAGSQRKQLDVQVNAKLYEELLKHLELAKLALRKETPLIQIIDSPKYPLEKKKLGRLKGGIIFAFIGGFFSVLYFVTKYWWKQVNAQPKNVDIA